MNFPTLIYNNKDKACCTVHTIEQYEQIKGYFKDELDHACLPYTELPASEAVRMFAEIQKEPLENSVDLSILSWSELRKEAKKLGVKLPLKAKRDTVEKAIYEVINGDSK